MSSSEASSGASAGAADAGANAEIEDLARRALAIAEKSLRDGTTDKIGDQAVQLLITAGTKLFANKTEMEERFFLPFTSPQAATATDVVVTVSEMLRAVNLNTFDLAMWFRRPRPDDK